MNRELFRLSEDEAAVIQYYRTMTEQSRAAIMATLQLHSEQQHHDTGNVVLFSARRSEA